MSDKFDGTKSRDKIMFYLLQFCLGTKFKDGSTYCHEGFSSGLDIDDQPKAGDLVRLISIRRSNWSICWLLDTRSDGQEFLCQNIETGEKCWWSNVGIGYLSRDVVAQHPEWRWTDRQHEFNSRWQRVCYKGHDAYMVMPLSVNFLDGHSFEIGTRTRHGLNDISPREIFPDWRKFTKKQMGEFYLKCVDIRKNKNKVKS